MKGKDLLTLAGCLAIPLAVGAIAGFATRAEVGGSWFQELDKPAFQPPNWVFGPVWTTLYILMGISLWLIFKAQPSPWRTRGLVVFAVQLVLNFLWSFIFFTWHKLGAASVEIVILWLAIVGMIICFFKVRPLAAILQFPYLAWVTFASTLTITLYFINR